jgi:hypothetical protein
MAVVVTIKDSETPSKTVSLASDTLSRLMVDGALFEKNVKYSVEPDYADKLLAMLDDQQAKFFKEVSIEEVPAVVVEVPKTVKVKAPKAPAGTTAPTIETGKTDGEGDAAGDAPQSSKIEEV